MVRKVYVGFPYLKSLLVSWFLGLCFLVSWFLGFQVSWFLGFLVSNFQGFKDSTIPYYQISISCFFERYWSHLQDFQDSITRIVGICRRQSFSNFPSCWISKRNKSMECFFSKRFRIFLDLLRYPGVSNDKNKWLWEERTLS